MNIYPIIQQCSQSAFILGNTSQIQLIVYFYYRLRDAKPCERICKIISVDFFIYDYKKIFNKPNYSHHSPLVEAMSFMGTCFSLYIWYKYYIYMILYLFKFTKQVVCDDFAELFVVCFSFLPILITPSFILNISKFHFFLY